MNTRHLYCYCSQLLLNNFFQEVFIHIFSQNCPNLMKKQLLKLSCKLKISSPSLRAFLQITKTDDGETKNVFFLQIITTNNVLFPLKSLLLKFECFIELLNWPLKHELIEYLIFVKIAQHIQMNYSCNVDLCSDFRNLT